MKQTSFADLAWAAKKKQTKRERFLAEMEQVVPWARLVALIKPHYPKAGGTGRQPMPLERMLRVYFMQQWYALSDPGMEEALYDVESMRRFAGIELAVDPVPDETTILNFRHLLERAGLTERIFAEVGALLAERGLLMRSGTIVDATIIEAPSSTKNASGKRDPEMSSTQKGTKWHFGMKVHIGTDTKSGLVHSLVSTTAAVGDRWMLPQLLHGEEREVYGDKAYGDARDDALAKEVGLRLRTMRQARRNTPLSMRQRAINRAISSTRAKVEFAFRVVKQQFGYMKTRYRGLAKNAAHQLTLFALANIYMARRHLLGARA
jgi:transposase, IS5 family